MSVNGETPATPAASPELVLTVTLKANGKLEVEGPTQEPAIMFRMLQAATAQVFNLATGKATARNKSGLVTPDQVGMRIPPLLKTD